MDPDSWNSNLPEHTHSGTEPGGPPSGAVVLWWKQGTQALTWNDNHVAKAIQFGIVYVQGLDRELPTGLVLHYFLEFWCN